MTKKSTAELQAEAKDLRKRLEALKEMEAIKKERKALEKEVQDLHRATSLKWKGLRKSAWVGKQAAKFFIEETRNLINEEDEIPNTCEKSPVGIHVIKKATNTCIYCGVVKEDEGESML